MTDWPQISVIAWLVLSTCSAIGAASRPHSRLTLSSKQQRFMAAAFAVSALTEASLLWVGGFFEGMF